MDTLGNSDSISEDQKYRQLNVSIISANLKDLGYLVKSGPFVEIRCDSVLSARKTDFAKKTLNPFWEEDFSILVKINTVLEFRLCNLHFVKPINVIGAAKVSHIYVFVSSYFNQQVSITTKDDIYIFIYLYYLGMVRI